MSTMCTCMHWIISKIQWTRDRIVSADCETLVEASKGVSSTAHYVRLYYSPPNVKISSKFKRPNDTRLGR